MGTLDLSELKSPEQILNDRFLAYMGYNVGQRNEILTAKTPQEAQAILRSRIREAQPERNCPRHQGHGSGPRRGREDAERPHDADLARDHAAGWYPPVLGHPSSSAGNRECHGRGSVYRGREGNRDGIRRGQERRQEADRCDGDCDRLLVTLMAAKLSDCLTKAKGIGILTDAEMAYVMKRAAELGNEQQAVKEIHAQRMKEYEAIKAPDAADQVVVQTQNETVAMAAYAEEVRNATKSGIQPGAQALEAGRQAGEAAITGQPAPAANCRG